jgi:surfeit locus 1 family protein
LAKALDKGQAYCGDLSETRSLLTPKWVIAHLVVLLAVVMFVRLGMWQLDRLEERRIENTVGEERFSEDPLEISVLVSGAGGDLESLEHRLALATGVFAPEDEILIRSQVHLGTAGFHVITPLVGEAGSAVLVNRGWIPLVLDEVPVTEAPPPQGVVTVEGWILLNQEKPPFGPTDPVDGRLSAMSRIDISRIQDQTSVTLSPVYLVALHDRGGELPVPVDTPVFDDEGPHLAYAIQWFAFALIAFVGYGFLLRKQTETSV